MTDPPSSSRPEGPRRATLRARTRTGQVRPEVIDALDELERSLGDVARWEQLLGGADPQDDWDHPSVLPGGRGRLLELDDFDDVDPIDEAEELDNLPRHLERAIVSLDDRLDEIAPPDPLLHFSGDLPAPVIDAPLPAPMVPDPSTSLLWQARTVEPAERVPLGDEADRRRRNGRVLTWTGIALLLALGALWVLPKQDNGDKVENEPLVTVTVTTPKVATTLFAPFTTAPTAESTVPAVVETTPTTKKKVTTQTTKATTKATVPSTTPTSVLGTPGPSSTTPPSTTTTQPPATTTTQPPATTTTTQAP